MTLGNYWEFDIVICTCKSYVSESGSNRFSNCQSLLNELADVTFKCHVTQQAIT
jgi:hypothetical protein